MMTQWWWHKDHWRCCDDAEQPCPDAVMILWLCSDDALMMQWHHSDDPMTPSNRRLTADQSVISCCCQKEKSIMRGWHQEKMSHFWRLLTCYYNWSGKHCFSSCDWASQQCGQHCVTDTREEGLKLWGLNNIQSEHTWRAALCTITNWDDSVWITDLNKDGHFHSDQCKERKSKDPNTSAAILFWWCHLHLESLHPNSIFVFWL